MFLVKRVKTLFLSLLPLYMIGILLIGCNNDNIIMDDANALSDYKVQNSRVFDGRDSLRSGFLGPTATQDNFAILTDFVLIEKFDPIEQEFFFAEITDPGNLDLSTPLFESRSENEILAPGGGQVTWGDFSGATGGIIVKCTEKGTHITVHLSDLIPNGVYTIQSELFDPNTGEILGRIGYTETDEKGKSIGSSFQASNSGEGHISGFIQSGALDMNLISDCMLDDVRKVGNYDWRTTAIYQIDGTPELNDAGTFVEQSGFTFETEDEIDIE